MQLQYLSKSVFASFTTFLFFLGVCLGLVTQAHAKDKSITLIHLSDVHGHIAAHDEDFPVSH